MNAVKALMITRLLTRNQLANHEEIPYGSMWWFIYAVVSCVLVIFAGIMSGLTLGLMSLGLVDLEILQQSGTPSEKKQAGFVLFLAVIRFIFYLFAYFAVVFSFYSIGLDQEILNV